MTTLVIAGEEAPDYGAEVFRHGRMVGTRDRRRRRAARRPSTA